MVRDSRREARLRSEGGALKTQPLKKHSHVRGRQRIILADMTNALARAGRF